MRIFCCLPILLSLLLLGCSAGATSAKVSGGGNKYNPYLQTRLPGGSMLGDKEGMLQEMGARPATLQDEVQHRPHWKEEVYPVVFGNRQGTAEVLVFLDYAAPQSEAVWKEVVKATRSLDPKTTKVVVLGKSSEKYGIELMGGGIWASYMRPQAALQYFTQTLGRWNAVKAQQAKQGRTRPFTYEYDATAASTDQPILYNFLAQVQPPVPGKDHVSIVRYAYDAGNVNLFQAVSAAADYGVKSFPAVVVNDRLLSQPTAQTIVDAVKK